MCILNFILIGIPLSTYQCSTNNFNNGGGIKQWHCILQLYLRAKHTFLNVQLCTSIHARMTEQIAWTCQSWWDKFSTSYLFDSSASLWCLWGFWGISICWAYEKLKKSLLEKNVALHRNSKFWQLRIWKSSNLCRTLTK
jgi:hypothetical protein